MAHKIPRCISWLSSIHPLMPGDIVATGTNHRGLHPFQDGDRVELEIESVRAPRHRHTRRPKARLGPG